MFEYQGHVVSLEWQAKQALTARLPRSRAIPRRLGAYGRVGVRAAVGDELDDAERQHREPGKDKCNPLQRQSPPGRPSCVRLHTSDSTTQVVRSV